MNLKFNVSVVLAGVDFGVLQRNKGLKGGDVLFGDVLAVVHALQQGHNSVQLLQLISDILFCQQ